MKNLQYSLSAKIAAFLFLFPASMLVFVSLIFLFFNYTQDITYYLGLNYSIFFTSAVIILPVSFVVSVVLFGYLLASAGIKEGEDTLELNSIDKIYLDIYLLIIGVLMIVGLILLRNLAYQLNDVILGIFIFFVLFYLYTLVMTSLITFTKRFRTQTLFTNSLLYRLLQFVGEAFAQWNAVYQSALAVILFGLINGFFLLNMRRMGLATVSFMLFNIFIFGLVIFLALQFNKLKKGVYAISQGDLETTLDSSDFVLGFKEQAAALNKISHGLQKALDERMRSERFKTELITNVSHDIKTPLTSMVNFVDLLKKEDLQNDTAYEYLSVLDNKTQRLTALIEDLMEASKATTGNISVKKEDIVVNELIKQLTGEYDERLREKGLDVILNFPKQKISIQADRRHMWRVMENLMSNIKKYAMPNTRVYIDVSIHKTQMKLSIKNISEEKLNISADELMERFVRGDRARNTEGSGLGLSIAKSLTELQGGTFDLLITGDLFEARIKFPLI